MPQTKLHFLEIFLTYSDYPVSRLRRGPFHGGVAPFVNLNIRRTIPYTLAFHPATAANNSSRWSIKCLVILITGHSDQHVMKVLIASLYQLSTRLGNPPIPASSSFVQANEQCDYKHVRSGPGPCGQADVQYSQDES